MKRIVSLIVSAVMLFAMTATAFAGPQMDRTMPDGAYLQYLELREAGDVFITSSTVSSGLLGHAGISISSSSILHIAGPGEHPDTISKNSWLNKYDEGWNKVYRHSDSSIAEDAAQWAEDTYKDSDAEYVITMDLESTDETYCSKLVWQAYYYGHTPSAANGPTWGVRLPYSLPDTIHNLDLVQEWL